MSSAIDPYDFRSVWKEETQRAGQRIDLPSLPSAYKGPRPWCRICQTDVDDWGYDRYAGDFFGVYARCHGDICGGLIRQNPPTAFEYSFRPEAFCFQEPHYLDFPLWFVAMDGSEVQMSVAQAATMKGGIYQTRFATFLRKHGMSVALGFSLLIPLLFKILAWCFD